MRFLRIGTTIARNLFTIYNPNFALRNLVRDPQDAYLYTRHGYFSPADLVKGYFKVWAEKNGGKVDRDILITAALESRDLKDWEKETEWIIGEHFRIPKGADVAAGDKEFNPSADWLPLIGGFLRVPYKNPKIINDYYELLDKQTELHNEYKNSALHSWKNL